MEEEIAGTIGKLAASGCAGIKNFPIFVRQTTESMRKIYSLMLVLQFVSLLTCSASPFYFHTVDVKSGLADNFVRDVARDSHGYIWIATINGLSRYNGYQIYNYMLRQAGARTNDVAFVRETADSVLWASCAGELFTYHRARDTWQKDGIDRLTRYGIKSKVQSFHVDDLRNMWVAADGILYHYDCLRRQLSQVPFHGKAPLSHVVSREGYTVAVGADMYIYKVAMKEHRLIPLGQVPQVGHQRDTRVFLDSHMNLWVYNSHSPAGTQWIFSLRTRQWRQPVELRQMGNAFVNALAQDNEGTMWVGTGNAGIHQFRYAKEADRLEWTANMTAFATRSSHISCFLLDDNNTMWVGSAKLGIAYTDMSRPSFTLVVTDGYEDVSALVEDRRGHLWMGFDGEGAVRKTKDGVTTHYSALRQQLPSDIVTSMTIGADGAPLVGTYGGGIARWDGTRFAPLHADCRALDYVKALAYDAHGSLWVATVDKGVVRVGPEGKTVNYTCENSALVSNGTLCLAIDSLHDIVYVGTSMGVAVYDCAQGKFVENKQLQQLRGSYVSAMMVCPYGMLWVGCRDGLWVYRPKDDTLAHLTTLQGMSHNTVRTLAKGDNCVWASTDNGLTCITMQAGADGSTAYKCLQILDSDGLQDAIFSNDAACTTSDGTVLMGCYTGYVSIPPGSFGSHYPQLSVRFTGCRVNEQIDPREARRLTIRHDDRLAVVVSAMVPALGQKVKYLYRFKGEKGWLRAPGNVFYFVALNPGKHLLQVKAELPGMMESEIAELPIEVRPPAWRSRPAMLLYLVLLAAAAYAFYRSSRRRHERQLALEQMEVHLKRYEMEEEKIRFFTNVGHDLKTPLTLVVAPLEKIRSTHLPDSIRTEVDVAWRNARQLYDLILQLLDFRRLDVGKEQLHLKYGDIVGFVGQTVQGFSYYAPRMQVHLTVKLPPESVEIDFDEQKMRRIITNLLSNAYKYNTDHGSVTVALDFTSREGQRWMALSVADTGIGIRDKRHVFDRFVQETHGQEQEGSGIGLHIVKEYVGLMGGHVDVDDNQPQGTIFTIHLPVTQATDRHADTTADVSVSQSDALVAGGDIVQKTTILVVDDNVDARLFLQRSLDDEYQVLVAANGQEALQVLAKADNVGLVVSDVMMPVMDGLQLFRRLKSDIRFSHIPVILLTAKSSEESIVEGLEEGAADYITKPFSLAVLRLRIHKILEWTHDVHTKVATGIDITPTDITVSSLDEELVANVIAQVEAHIHDIDFTVVQLSSAVGMTRGHLYKKLMAITGKSPLEFMRIIKLKRGKSLLEQGKTNISEVADMVGLSPKQFAHHFKMMYGDTPSDFLKKQKKLL